jgi:plasmid maintenance system antidote protein VapI
MIQGVTYSNPVADAVRAALASANVTSRMASKHLDMHEVTFSRKVQGHRPFTTEEIYRLAAWLNVPVTDLMPEAVA